MRYGLDLIYCAENSVDIRFQDKQASLFEKQIYYAGETHCIVIRRYLENPISDYDNQVCLQTRQCKVLFRFFCLFFLNLQKLLLFFCCLYFDV